MPSARQGSDTRSSGLCGGCVRRKSKPLLLISWSISGAAKPLLRGTFCVPGHWVSIHSWSLMVEVESDQWRPAALNRTPAGRLAQSPMKLAGSSAQ